ncbi:unnamed protein product [Lymnaea stagnalis]|uniref:Uncharacterized protein n=1 Tax=Lymnaea stagnalis TaxID=6523 RepID=A0AAV2I7G4_LYMST
MASEEPIDVVGEVANIITLCALLIYLYHLIGCHVFRSVFLRQLAYIFQTVRLVILLGILLPCLTHWQAFALYPKISPKEFPYMVIALLFLNVVFSLVIHSFADYLWLFYNGQVNKWCRKGDCRKAKCRNCVTFCRKKVKKC